MVLGSVTFRDVLKPGEEQIIRDITASTGAFYADEVDVAEELARENLRIGAEKSGYFFVLAVTNDKPIGYTCYGPTPCTKNSFDLYWIVVEESYRDSGIGKQLIARTEEKIASSGGRKIYVETSSRDPYIAARKFYLKNNYIEEAVLRDFYDVGDDKLICVKDLK